MFICNSYFNFYYTLFIYPWTFSANFNKYLEITSLGENTAEENRIHS